MYSPLRFGRWSGAPGGQAQTDTQYKAVAYVLDAICFEYTCRRLIDLSNDCRYAAEQAKAIGLPLYMTEWSSDPGSRSPYHDTTDTAAWIISSVASLRKEGLKAYSYWTFSDV